MLKFFTFFLILLVVIVAPTLPAHAQLQLIPESCVGERAGTECGLRELIIVFINFGFIILGLTGSLALLYFVYGGFVWLTSGGSPERITKGKNIIVQSVIGILIIFGAAVGVQYFQQVLGKKEEAATESAFECTDDELQEGKVDCPCGSGKGTFCIEKATDCTPEAQKIC